MSCLPKTVEGGRKVILVVNNQLHSNEC